MLACSIVDANDTPASKYNKPIIIDTIKYNTCAASILIPTVTYNNGIKNIINEYKPALPKHNCLRNFIIFIERQSYLRQ